MMAATTTEPAARVAPGAAMKPAAKRRRTAGPDRLTVVLLALAAFLVVLSLLADELQPVTGRAAARRIVLKRVIETKVIETVIPTPGANATGSSMTSSVSSSGSAAPAYTSGAPVTRTS